MNTPRTFRTLALALGTLVMMSGFAFAQTSLGRIVGVVRDTSGAVVSGANITVTNELTGQEVAVATTGSEGGFLIPALINSSYTVKIEAKGFKTASYTEVKVDPGKDYSLNATVEVGETKEVVQVTAGADLVNTSNPEITNTVTRRQIQDLPLNGRNPIELIRAAGRCCGTPDSSEHVDQWWPPDLDSGNAGRNQHSGQLHSYEFSGLCPEPSDIRHDFRVHDHDQHAGRGRRGWRFASKACNAIGSE